jgi:hypothetical protein
MKLIETQTLGTAAASIEFTSIPQTFTDLVVLASCRSSRDNATDSLISRFNGDTNSANYTGRRLRNETGTGVSDTAISVLALTGSAATSNTFGSIVFYIPNYTGSTNKSVSAEGVNENNSSTDFRLCLNAVLWSNTAAITSITLVPGTGPNLVTGSTISLYGITKGSDGIVTTS